MFLFVFCLAAVIQNIDVSLWGTIKNSHRTPYAGRYKRYKCKL